MRLAAKHEFHIWKRIKMALFVKHVFAGVIKCLSFEFRTPNKHFLSLLNRAAITFIRINGLKTTFILCRLTVINLRCFEAV